MPGKAEKQSRSSFSKWQGRISADRATVMPQKCGPFFFLIFNIEPKKSLSSHRTTHNLSAAFSLWVTELGSAPRTGTKATGHKQKLDQRQCWPPIVLTLYFSMGSCLLLFSFKGEQVEKKQMISTSLDFCSRLLGVHTGFWFFLDASLKQGWRVPSASISPDGFNALLSQTFKYF